MKKLTYLFAAAAVLVACNGGKGYTVTGTVEGAEEGDTIYLASVSGRNFVNVDSTVIKNGKFEFKGVQDTVANRYIVTKAKADATPKQLYVDFFLENGKINVNLTSTVSTVSGTPNNDAYQAARTEMNKLGEQQKALYAALRSDSLTDEQRAAKMGEYQELQNKYIGVMKDAAAQNITKPVGVYFLKQANYYMEPAELDSLLQQIPADLAADKQIVAMKERLERQKATAVGQKFTDFEMKDLKGNAVKLSDYVGKGKVVLVDFWASWCGPCRQEMPNLVEAYKQYKDKGFEIVGVSLDRDQKSWEKGVKELNITWPQMSDLKFWECEGARLYAVNGIPHVVLIDGEGTIIGRGLHGKQLQEAIAEALK
ncbi:MAG: AhpC/TSA family protein [Bacteroides sp.]|nr:AhpC/TSA family protein [Bacteroides sp.]